MSDEVALRPVREDDLPMLGKLTQDPEKTGERVSSSGSGGLIPGAGGEAGTRTGWSARMAGR